LDKRLVLSEKDGDGRSPSRCLSFFGKAAGLLLFFCLLLPRHALFAQAGGSAEGDNLSVHLALIGPGDELYFWWGHLGLVVEDHLTGQSLIYDWGVFSFENENFFLDFAFGRLIYMTAVSKAEITYRVYTQTNRDVILFTLNLPPEKKQAIAHFAANNVLPENRDYEYHYFRDNCSTRIRDILDMATDGQFKERYGNAPGYFTLRQHVRRHTWFNPFFDWILNFWMGQVIDTPMTVWDDMFLPAELAKRANNFRFTDADGNERPLISSIQVINEAVGRPAVLDTPRLQWPRQLLASVLFSSVLLLLCCLCGNKKGFRVFSGLVHSFLALFFGAAGLMLFFLTLFTNHDYTFENINILFVNPLYFVALPCGIILAFTKNAKKRATSLRVLRIFWAYVFISGLVTIALRFFPAFYQQNQVTQAMVLPLALVMVYVTTRAMQREGSAA